MTPHPTYPPIETMCLLCPTFAVPIENCNRQGCPFAWQREGKERRERDAERDRRGRGRMRDEAEPI